MRQETVETFLEKPKRRIINRDNHDIEISLSRVGVETVMSTVVWCDALKMLNTDVKYAPSTIPTFASKMLQETLTNLTPPVIVTEDEIGVITGTFTTGQALFSDNVHDKIGVSAQYSFGETGETEQLKTFDEAVDRTLFQ